MKKSKRFQVTWRENRVHCIYAEVVADSPEEAAKKAQAYDFNEENNEFVEESVSHTDDMSPARVKEMEDGDV